MTRCTYTSYLCHTGKHFTIMPTTHFIFRSTYLHRLLTHIFTENLDSSHYPAFHNLINIMEDQDNICACEILENEDENVFVLTLKSVFVYRLSAMIIHIQVTQCGANDLSQHIKLYSSVIKAVQIFKSKISWVVYWCQIS